MKFFFDVNISIKASTVVFIVVATMFSLEISLTCSLHLTFLSFLMVIFGPIYLGWESDLIRSSESDLVNTTGSFFVDDLIACVTKFFGAVICQCVTEQYCCYNIHFLNFFKNCFVSGSEFSFFLKVKFFQGLKLNFWIVWYLLIVLWLCQIGDWQSEYAQLSCHFCDSCDTEEL